MVHRAPNSASRFGMLLVDVARAGVAHEKAVGMDARNPS